MKIVIHNEEKILDSEINNYISRAKALIINSNDEILLGYGSNNYQFPGGHLEENESYEECLVREIKEEAGIILTTKKIDPFLVIKYYSSNYPKKGLNTLFEAHYFVIKSDEKPNLDLLSLTEDEIESNYELRYIHKDKVINELENSLETCSRKNVVLDTLEVLKEYLKRR